jgi:hypothetical protein
MATYVPGGGGKPSTFENITNLKARKKAPVYDNSFDKQALPNKMKEAAERRRQERLKHNESQKSQSPYEKLQGELNKQKKAPVKGSADEAFQAQLRKKQAKKQKGKMTFSQPGYKAGDIGS